MKVCCDVFRGETAREELKNDECISHHPLVDHLRALFAASRLSRLCGGKPDGSNGVCGGDSSGGVAVDTHRPPLAPHAADLELELQHGVIFCSRIALSLDGDDGYESAFDNSPTDSQTRRQLLISIQTTQ